ncbi:hypothetical protein ACE6H2_021500 [Prunus campanulata]
MSQLMLGSMANPRLRSLLRWRRWARKDWAIAAVGFTVIAFALTLLSNSWRDEPDSEITGPFNPITASDLYVLMEVRLATISIRALDLELTIGCFTLMSYSFIQFQCIYMF